LTQPGARPRVLVVATLRVTLEPVTRERVAPGDVAVEATVVNEGARPEPFHEHQARHGSLVLQVEDPSGRRVLLPPPPPPNERDLGQATPLAPGASVTLRYVGFLDARRDGGDYRVRWFSHHEDLGGSPRTPLVSDWIVVEVAHRGITRTTSKPSFGALLLRLFDSISMWVRLLVQRILLWLCRAVVDKEVDRYITETITNGTPSSWNNTYAWNARFHVRVDQPQQRIVVTIRVRLSGISPSSATAWVTTVDTAWTNRFKDCAVLGCASNGYPILLALQYVTSGEHHTVSVSPTSTTAHMLSWGLTDTDQAHEAGHVLGNKEEYFTVDGVDYGPGRQPGGNIMNNPANPPVAAHYWLIQDTVDALLGINYSLSGGSTRSVNVPCRYF
jgi:hypothetical protein